MPILSLYKIVLPGYVEADLPPDCFKGEEHGKTIGVAHKVCKDVIQVWDKGWDLYFPREEYERISKGRRSISMVQLQTILEEMYRQEQIDVPKV